MGENEDAAPTGLISDYCTHATSTLLGCSKRPPSPERFERGPSLATRQIVAVVNFYFMKVDGGTFFVDDEFCMESPSVRLTRIFHRGWADDHLARS